MKSINLNSEVMVKLTDLGKQLYHLYVYENQEKEAILLYNLDLNNNLKISLKKIFEVFGISDANLEEVFASNFLFLKEQKEFSLDDIVGIKLSEYGKKVYYIHISCIMTNMADNEDKETYEALMSNRLGKDGLLMISLKELIMIFGSEKANELFDEENLMVDEKDLKEPGALEETSSRNRS